jgi:hypothetical protein
MARGIAAVIIGFIVVDLVREYRRKRRGRG